VDYIILLTVFILCAILSLDVNISYVSVAVLFLASRDEKENYLFSFIAICIIAIAVHTPIKMKPTAAQSHKNCNIT